MKLKAIIFDFDGVILDSVDVKLSAFTKVFDDCDKLLLEKIDTYNRTCGAISRYNKIRYCYENILKLPLSNNELDELASKYGKLTINGVIESPFINGIVKFLQKYHDKLDLYIVSATPQEDLDEIVNRRNIRDDFKGIYGTRYSKVDMITAIVKNGNYSYDEIVYVGDSISDLIDSKKAGIRFIGKGDIFKIDAVINDLNDLEKCLW